MYIQSSTINPSHSQEWEKSAVSAEIIARNVSTVEDARELDRLLNRNNDRRWKHSEDLIPGWFVSGVDPKSGERTLKGAQYKPDKALIDPDSHKPRKYFSPARLTLSPLFLEMSDHDYWSKLLFDVQAPIVITEGAKKAGSVLSQGIPCISIPGVATGAKLGRLRPELELYCKFGRSVYLAFDRDIIHKPQVRRALHNLGRMIAAKGAVVHLLEWNNFQKGIDDFCAAGGSVADRIESARTLEEWATEQDEEDDEANTEFETCKLAARYRLVESKLQNRVRWNSLKGVCELDGQPADFDELRIHLALKYNIDLPSEDCGQIVQHLAKQATFNPVAEYLNGCAALYDADSALLDAVATTYLGADLPLHQTFIRKTLIAAVARALNPGCKVDTVCILSGPQEAGKSSFWSILACDWFDDTIGSVSDKDERLKLHQSWFIEWAELESVFSRKDMSAVKAFITTQHDMVRPPYGRAVKSFARPSIIVGTTNHDEFLRDPTGNRRFWVVPVKVPFIPLNELMIERDRIWAAATHAYHAGEPWTLSADQKQAAREAVKEFETSDPWDSVILEFIQNLPKVTASEILESALKMDIDRQDKAAQMRVTNLLKGAGWTTSREVVHGKRLRFWFPPSSIETGCPGCPEDGQTVTAVAGQPTGQPTGQPMDDPPKNELEPLPPIALDNLDNLDNLFPKTSRKPENEATKNDSDDLKNCSDIVMGDFVKYTGSDRSLKGVCRQKWLYVVWVDGATANVKHENWAIAQSVPLADLQRRRRTPKQATESAGPTPEHSLA